MPVMPIDERLLFEKSVPGRAGFQFPASGLDNTDLPVNLRRKEKAALPEISELDVVRHFTNLSRLNFSVDTQFYPLGSCTMKYNPRFQEKAAALEGFTDLHPLAPLLPGGPDMTAGAAAVIGMLDEAIAEITGMDAVTCQPMAGAHGEMTGVMIIEAYHRSRGDSRRTVIVPDSSHGTNPASAAMAGYEVVTIPTASYGDMDLDAFRAAMNNDVAAVMMTCPNTLGLFNPHIREICDIAHAHGALVYYDGANLNAIMGKVRPGDVGFDVVHVNVHKTFATPHGGGGPGAGPVGVKKELVPFLPGPVVVKKDGVYSFEPASKLSIGRVSGYYGNFGVLVKALAYILFSGGNGLVRATETAVLNANYIRARLEGSYDLPYPGICMHECVFSASRQLKENNVSAMDIAKALIDRGYHPPTVYFPLIVKEAMMIEPTETESKDTLDGFIDAMLRIAESCKTDPASIKAAPVKTPRSRFDETKAAREICVRCQE